jgi:formylglycine-generating enzyme required for sulfatase activity
MVRDTTSITVLEAFLAKHGDDPIYRALAEERLALLKAPASPAATPAEACAGGLLVAVASREDCLKPGDIFRDCWVCPEMVVVPAGTFTMGSPESENLKTYVDEGPQHEVTIARPFAVGRLEVSYEEWDECVSHRACNHIAEIESWGRGRQPLSNVTWHDAQTYVAWLSKITSQTYRLLSEAEWEYAARAGTTTPFSTGTTLTRADANIDDTWGVAPNKVGGYKPNAFGLHDMHGNVSEWVEDCYNPGQTQFNDAYVGAPTDGSASTTGVCNQRVLRGCWWQCGPFDSRSAKRWSWDPNGRLVNHGLRVARTLAP